MAKAVGIDPKTKRRVKFDVLNKEFMKSYFDILHHPYEDDGVDFAERMAEIHRELLSLQAESNDLMDTISQNMKEMGI